MSLSWFCETVTGTAGSTACPPTPLRRRRRAAHAETRSSARSESGDPGRLRNACRAAPSTRHSTSTPAARSSAANRSPDARIVSCSASTMSVRGMPDGSVPPGNAVSPSPARPTWFRFARSSSTGWWVMRRCPRTDRSTAGSRGVLAWKNPYARTRPSGRRSSGSARVTAAARHAPALAPPRNTGPSAAARTSARTARTSSFGTGWCRRPRAPRRPTNGNPGRGARR